MCDPSEEMSSSATRSPRPARTGHRPAAQFPGSWRRRGWCPPSGRGRRSRCRRLSLPSGSNCEVEPKTRWLPSAEIGSCRCSRPVRRSAARSSPSCPARARRRACAPGSRCCRRRSRASRSSRQMRTFRGSRRLPAAVEPKGSAEGVPEAGMPDVLGGPAAFGACRHVGIDAVVGGVAGARDAAGVDAVKNPRRSLGLRIAGKGRAAVEVRLDVVAAGVRGRCELVGAAIEQLGGAGLLPRERVDALSTITGTCGKVRKM